MAGAFDGLRVLDFTGHLSGWMATMPLADHGAEVICIEPPRAASTHHEPAYIATHRNKLRVTLDVERWPGIRQARDLITTADVAVFDQRPGELERLGLDAVSLRSRHPGLVHTWLPPYGDVGRWSQLPTEDMLIQAVTGCAAKQFTSTDQPMWMIAPQMLIAQGTLGAGATAAALYERARSGQGQAVTVSGLHAFAGVESGAIRSADVIRMGGRDSRGGMPNYRLYQCADGEWFFLATLTAQFFLHALDTIDRLDLLTMEGIDGEFTNMLAPPGNAIVREALDAHFRTRPRAEWLELLDGAGVPCGPVGRRDDWFTSETVRANGMRVELDHPELGRVAIPGVPVIFADTPGEVRELVRDVALDDLAPHAPTADGTPREGIAGGGGPLSGVTVLDFGQVIAGTYPSSILANWGANVIKVEAPGGDIFRAYGLGFLGYNHGKRGIVIDLKQEAGRETLHDLVRHADVVIDNFRMGVTGRLGMDHATLSAINPRVITISVTGYGPKGPLAAKPGFDPLLQAISGIMHHQGGGAEPIFHQLPVNDVAAGMTTAFAAAAALYAREQTGRGQHVDTSLANVSVVCQTPDITEVPGREPPVEGSLDCVGISALRRFYRCADGWIAIAASDPAQFHGLCNALDHPIWAARYIAEQALTAPVDGDLAGEIAAVLAEMPRDEALDRLLTHGVPTAPDAGDPDLYEDPWLRASGLWAEYEDPVFGTITAVSGFAAFDRTPGGFGYGVPRLGEHTREVLREAGFDDARLDALEAGGAIAQFREP